MAKITPKKSSIVSDLSDLVSKSKSIGVVDYKGLKVSQATELRKSIHKAGGEMIITKNTLFKIAAKQKDLPLSGTSAFIFSLNDEVSALKAVADFAKKNSLPNFKAGLLGDKILSESEVKELSAIPDKNTLLTRLVYSFSWNIGQFVRTLDAVAKSRGVN